MIEHETTALTTARKDFPQFGSIAWAVHDGKRATYLQVGAHDNSFLGVFSCEKAVQGGDYVEGCPWLGYCETDAYVNGMIGRPLWEKVRAGGFADDVVFGLLAELHNLAGAR